MKRTASKPAAPLALRNIVKPAVAALLFFCLTIYFTNNFAGTLSLLHLPSNSELGLFLSSPFNMATEGNPLYNLYLPTLLIFVVGFYLKNFNSAFQKKCNLRSIFVMSVIASYVKSVGSMLYYRGYSDFGISLGTSIITISFIAAFVISLEVYVQNKERVAHLYPHFMLSIMSVLIILIMGLMLLSFFTTSSFIVHLMGLSAFLVMFVPYYERANMLGFIRHEEKVLISLAEGKA
jgi:hypothetical protein